METYNSDPKPGRLILPLVLIGMIATTYTFINRVAVNNEIEIVSAGTTSTTLVDEIEDTTTTSTTTTIPENVVNYLEEITGEKIQAVELGKKVLETNQRWDDKITTYQEAQQEFQSFIDDFESFVTIVSTPGPPNDNASLVTTHQEIVVLVNLLFDDSKELLEGLTAPDTGERRSAALESFNSNLDQFILLIEQTVASATSS